MENNRPSPTGCCTLIDPAAWEGKEFSWKDKLFAKDRVHAFLHIPLNFGTVMTRCMKRIEAAQTEKPDLWLSDENSLWGSDLLIAVTKEVQGMTMARLSGTYLAKVFEGPYKDAPQWAKEMTAFVESKGKALRKIYFFYTACPKCAKAYGKNYVVLIAEVG